jgi:RNA methyltransferase, TrmH family
MPSLEVVTSPANPLVKELRRAAEKGALTRDGCCVAEGAHLLDEALRSGCEVKAIIGAESAAGRIQKQWLRASGARLIVLKEALFAEISTTENSQGVLALVVPPAWTLDQVLAKDEGVVAVLDGVQDPGNTGAILRSADAFGALGAVLLKGTSNPYNPKSARASAGSVFRLPLALNVAPEQAMSVLEERGFTTYAADTRAALTIDQADFAGPCAVIIGSEAHGVSAGWKPRAREVRIPTEQVESLNAAVAAAILFYEARRARMRL